MPSRKNANRTFPNSRVFRDNRMMVWQRLGEFRHQAVLHEEGHKEWQVKE